MAIAPIQGLMTNSPITRIEPMNYQVKNDSEVSDVYANEATRATTGVNAPSPVQYPNAYATADPVQKQAEIVKTDKAYNSLASEFEGNITGYDSNSNGTSYATLGATIDLYA